jgi:hypothetical protein
MANVTANGRRAYQWAIGILVALCCVAGGAAFGRHGSVTRQEVYAVTSAQAAAYLTLATELTEHVRLDGHPVMIERVESIRATLNDEFERINAKLTELLDR